MKTIKDAMELLNDIDYSIEETDSRYHDCEICGNDSSNLLVSKTEGDETLNICNDCLQEAESLYDDKL